MALRREPDDLTQEQLLDIVKGVREALWPEGDATHTWTPETLDEIARVVTKYDAATPDELALLRRIREARARASSFWSSAAVRP